MENDTLASQNQAKTTLLTTADIDSFSPDTAASYNDKEAKILKKKEEKERDKQAKLEKFLAKKDKQMLSKTAAASDGTVTDGSLMKPKFIKDTKAIIQYETVFRQTPSGEKKLLPEEMPNAYSPHFVEASWYDWWEKNGFFTPEYVNSALQTLKDNKQFVIVIPPPNVTGTLHVGHALSSTVEDAFTRWNRMCGRRTLWVPGCDHAGIATQVVVEKRLWREGKKSRHEIGREAFVREVWKWKDEKGHLIYDQLRKLGVSVDWQRTRYTMDPSMSRAVTEAFCRWHEQGVIYRDTRLINWSCTLRSAISDIEVEKNELTGRTLLAVPGYDANTEKVEFGVLTLFAYRIKGDEAGGDGGEIIVATTRVETMLGDTAIAVHPDDDRYRKFHGKFAQHPFVDRRLPVVCDEFVEMSFGTGAVKITPAHDANDYAVGKRHKLPFITIFDDVGLMRPNCGKFAGMKRFLARRAVTNELKQLGLFREARDNAMIVPICSRSKDVVEPLIKEQWFVNCQDLGRQACDVVRNDQLKLIPSFHKTTWFAWMENIRDWCISRQLWWGHRIPAYFVSIKNDKAERSTINQENWVSARTEEEALQKAVKRFGVSAEQIELKQDEDVLDTWFSSGLFPFSVFGWPENTEDLKKFYPTTLLETGHDILFFWVAKMVMMGLGLTGQLPFTEVYLHAMVRDAHGRKMSKSLGNVIDPIDVIQGITLEQLHRQLEDNSNLDTSEVEKAKKGQKVDFPNGIPECGTDAVRFALCTYTSQARDINLDVLRVQGYRFFANKLWNAMRFALAQLGASFTPLSFQEFQEISASEKPLLRPFDRWILSRAAFAVDECNTAFENYELFMATTACYNFWLYDLCDVYLECCKPVFAKQDGVADDDDDKNDDSFIDSRQTLYTALDIGLRLISPFMPFISEELYQRLPRRSSQADPPSICVTPYPGRLKEHAAWRGKQGIDEQVSIFMDVVRAIRSLRADYDIMQSKEERKNKTVVYVECHSAEARKQLAPLVSPYLQCLSNSASIILLGSDSGAGAGDNNVHSIPRKCAELNVGNAFRVHLELGNVDWDREIGRATDRLQKLDVECEKLQKTLAVAGYADKVPVSVQEAQQEKLTAQAGEKERIRQTIDKLKQFKEIK